jgi:two-component system, response regulator PdtaR
MHSVPRLVEPKPESPTNILVVEDDARIRTQICEYLRLRAFVVFEVASGDDALSFLEQDTSRIDCVFSDIQMPGHCDGFGLAHWVLANRPELPILLTSGKYRSEDLDSVLRGVSRVLPKPYRGHAVEAGIATLMAQFRTQGPLHGPLIDEVKAVSCGLQRSRA